MYAEPQEFFCISSRLTENSAHLQKTPARHKISIQISHKISKDNQPEVLKQTGTTNIWKLQKGTPAGPAR